MISSSQILLSLIIIFVIFKTIAAYKKKNLSLGFVLIWIIFWITGLITIFQQNLVIQLAHTLGISRGVDLVIYISLIAVFYMIYRILVRIEDLEREITQVVRKITLKRSKKSHS